VKATQLDPQSAAAIPPFRHSLRPSQELPKANDAFSKAQDIYQAMSSQEGLAEVYYQRGSLLARSGDCLKPKSSWNGLWSCHEVRPTITNRSGRIATQQRVLREGDSNRAKTIAADASSGAIVNIRTLAANGLIDLGYTLLARGEFADARAYFQRALDFARQGQVDSIGSAEPG
jgi:tetratricopeptide (TPR) repeat protein